MNVVSRWAIGIWLAFIVSCIFVISRTEFSTDLSAFLPRSPTPAQQVLVEQLREGVVSRLILVGLEGATPEILAHTSKQLAAQLRTQADFVSVNNGEHVGEDKDHDFLWKNRYLLSPAITPEHFSVAALRNSLEEDLQLLGSPAGALVKKILKDDPSGELIRLLEQLEGQARPAMQEGVWFSKGGKRALLVLQTKATGYDIDAQERAVAVLKSTFAKLAGHDASVQLQLSGPGVFSVSTRDRIKGDAWRFSLIATVLIACLLLLVYRSLRVLILGLLPVASGALAGIAAVSLGFGSVHGITLGFGATLIGEGVDYAIYLFTQIAPSVSPKTTFKRIWPTLRLGVLTSICGFSAMLFSGFPGLAQLGMFSIVGLIVAVTVTRWVLPALLPKGFTARAVTSVAPIVMALVKRAPVLRIPLLLVVVSAFVILIVLSQRGPLWSDELSSLSPLPNADQLLDEQLRNDIGAPDVRYLIVVNAKDEEAALQASENIAVVLHQMTEKGVLQGFESPATYLPSLQMQRARQAALPTPQVLRENLQQALHELPFQPDLFKPFLENVAQAKTQPLSTRSSLQGTNLALRLDSLLVKREHGWAAMLSLRGVNDPEAITKEIAKLPGPQAIMLDMKNESDQLYQTYRRGALMFSLFGGIAIVILLFANLRSPRRVFEVLAPLAAAVIIVTCVLVLNGHMLSIFHLVGLLLVVAVGSNYALFFDRPCDTSEDRERMLVSLLFANISTMIGFGLLAFSHVPLLKAIGSTVGMGAILSLVFSAILIVRQDSNPVPKNQIP